MNIQDPDDPLPWCGRKDLLRLFLYFFSSSSLFFFFFVTAKGVVLGATPEMLLDPSQRPCLGIDAFFKLLERGVYQLARGF